VYFEDIDGFGNHGHGEDTGNQRAIVDHSVQHAECETPFEYGHRVDALLDALADVTKALPE